MHSIFSTLKGRGTTLKQAYPSLPGRVFALACVPLGAAPHTAPPPRYARLTPRRTDASPPLRQDIRLAIDAPRHPARGRSVIRRTSPILKETNESAIIFHSQIATPQWREIATQSAISRAHQRLRIIHSSYSPATARSRSLPGHPSSSPVAVIR